jgi:enoyl-CoA hydratase
MRDIGGLAFQQPGIEAATHPLHDELPHRIAGFQLGLAGVKGGKGPGEHHLREHRVLSDEASIAAHKLHQIRAWIFQARKCTQSMGKQSEPLEEHLAHQSALVSEQLIDSRRRSVSPAGNAPGREPRAFKMTDELARYELDSGIATVTIDDGKVNAFSIQMLRAIHAAFDQAQQDGAVVLLRGRERCFSAGFDLKVFRDEPEHLIEMLTLGARLAERIMSFDRPVVVACTGHDVAAGSFLLLAADVRIGLEGPFQIGLNEVRIGLVVPWFAIELARQRLHPNDFYRAVGAAEMYSPRDAVGAGLLDRVLTADELDDAARQAAGQLAELDSSAYAATKMRVRQTALRAIRAAIETELGSAASR